MKKFELTSGTAHELRTNEESEPEGLLQIAAGQLVQTFPQDGMKLVEGSSTSSAANATTAAVASETNAQVANNNVSYTYATLDAIPASGGVSGSGAFGINISGQIVGTLLPGFVGGGYLYSGGTYTTFTNVSAANGINDAGQIVGLANGFGFLHSGGDYTTGYIRIGLGEASTANGINDAGQIVGSYNFNNHGNGFLYTSGSYTTINDPLATLGSGCSGINNLGQIVGSYTDATGYHGFLYENSVYTTLDDPFGVGATDAHAINDLGQIVGSYYDGTRYHGFLYSNGVFNTIDDPLATAINGTLPFGVNNLGQIVGNYFDNAGRHGFVATETATNNLFVSFQSQVTYQTGTGPFSIAIGDFDRNSTSDLVSANVSDSSNSISLLLNDGRGHFTAQPALAPGFSPEAIATGDFNGDGKLDLVVTDDLSNSAVLFLGNGNASFASPRPFSTAGSSAASVIAADFNNDGRLDLAVTNFSSYNVSIMLGNGDGTFSLQPQLPATGVDPFALAAGDLNRDGNVDLAVANFSSNTISVLLGNGNGTFAAQSVISGFDHPRSVAIGDLNGDGRLDLVVANFGSNTVSVLLGSGNGTLYVQRDFSTGSRPYSVAIGDLNGDGRMDLAVANSGSDSVSVLLGNGDGSYQSQATFVTGSFPDYVVIGDLNNDGRPDLAVANQSSNTISVLLNTTIFPNTNHSPVASNISAPANEDTNNPVTLTALFSDPDANDPHTFTIDLTGTIGHLVNNGDGTFSYDPKGNFEYLGVGETATDTFHWTVIDSHGASSTASATVTIHGENDAPVAVPDFAAVQRGGTIPLGAMPSVRANDYDPDIHDGLNVTAVNFNGQVGAIGQPISGLFGTLTLYADGNYTYAANTNSAKGAIFNSGVDFFNYTIDDGHARQADSTLIIAVQSPGAVQNHNAGLQSAAHIFSSFAANGEIAVLAALAEDSYHLTHEELLTARPGVNVMFPFSEYLYSQGLPQGMRALTSADLPDLAPHSSGDSSFPNTGLTADGIYIHGNAAALVARSADSLFLAFRGTNDAPTLFQELAGGITGVKGTYDSDDWHNMDRYYDLLRPLINDIDSYVRNHSEIGHVYVTGHSLGGAMVERFMHDHVGPRAEIYEGVTFASPGYSSFSVNEVDSRVLNIHIDGDAVQLSPYHHRGDDYQILDNTGLFGPYFTTTLLYTQYGDLLHDMDLDYRVAQLISSASFSIPARSLAFNSQSDETTIPVDIKIVPQIDHGNSWGVDFAGSDELLVKGTAGRDIIQQARGTHILVGSAGEDTFVFSPQFGTSVIEDFHPGQDVIQFDHSVFGNAEAVLHNIRYTTSNDGTSVGTIQVHDHDVVKILLGTFSGQLHESDFHIV